MAGGFSVTGTGGTRNGLVRLNVNGILDPTFNAGPITNTRGPSTNPITPYATGIALQADGKILLAGDFTAVNGLARGSMARVNADGSPDASFNPGLGFGSNSSDIYGVRGITITLQPDGLVLASGDFASYNGAPRSYLARIYAIPGLTATRPTPAAANVSAYPNPARPGQRITLTGQSATTLTLTNALGQSLSLPATFSSTQATTILPAGLAPGVYRLATGTKTSLRLVIE